ncbi:lysophospholipid acyltransferase family protein [Chloroflexota bacterium]
MKPWFYYVVRLLVRVLLFLFTHWQVKGRDNLPNRGGVLVIANHLSLADPPILIVSLTRKAIFMAKKELFRSRFTGYFISSFGSFPVHRGQLDRNALRQADQVLAQGLALVMFPEGTRSHSGQLQPAFPGSALIARRNNVPILPVGISGTEKIKGIAWLLRRPEITVNIGQPFHLPTVNGKLTRLENTRLTDYMMRHIAELLPQEYQGEYAGKSNGIKD